MRLIAESSRLGSLLHDTLNQKCMKWETKKKPLSTWKLEAAKNRWQMGVGVCG